MLCFKNCGRKIENGGYRVMIGVIDISLTKKFVPKDEVKICTQCFLKELLSGNIIRENGKYILPIAYDDKPTNENGGS